MAFGQAAGKPAAAGSPAAANAGAVDQEKGNADLEKMVKRLVAVQENWGPKTSTPGVSLKFVPVKHEGGKFEYKLQLTGAPKGKVYSMMSWPVTVQDAREDGGGVTLNDAGVAVCEGTADRCKLSKANDPVSVTVQPKAGEPIRLGLLSSDRTVRAFAEVTPLPLLGRDKGCRLEATLMTPHAEIVWLEAEGLPPNESFQFISDTEGVKKQVVGKADAAGKFHTVMLPEAKGKERGMAIVAVKAQGCAPSIKLAWGK